MKESAERVARVLRQMEEESRARAQLLEARWQEALQRIDELEPIYRQLHESVAHAVAQALQSGEDPEAVIRAHAQRARQLREQRDRLLEQNGFDGNYLTWEPACPLCGDSGYQGLQLCSCVRARCAKLAARELSPLLQGAERRFSDFSFAFYDDRPDPRTHLSPRANAEMNYDRCVDFARQFGRHHTNLLLFGPSGLGKTFLSTCIAREVSAKGYSVRYDTASGIAGVFERMKFESDEEARRQVREYLTCDLLILDDLGAEMTTAFTISALYDLINGRLLAQRCTVVSTNLQPGDLASRYSPAIASRLTGEYAALRFFGDDIRQKPGRA